MKRRKICCCWDKSTVDTHATTHCFAMISSMFLWTRQRAALYLPWMRPRRMFPRGLSYSPKEAFFRGTGSDLRFNCETVPQCRSTSVCETKTLRQPETGHAVGCTTETLLCSFHNSSFVEMHRGILPILRFFAVQQDWLQHGKQHENLR